MNENEDFAHTAALLRAALNNEQRFKAIMSNNFNIILAALDIAASTPKAKTHHEFALECQLQSEDRRHRDGKTNTVTNVYQVDFSDVLGQWTRIEWTLGLPGGINALVELNVDLGQNMLTEINKGTNPIPGMLRAAADEYERRQAIRVAAKPTTANPE